MANTDFSDAKQVAVVLKHIDCCDVVVENWSPGQLKAIGIDREQLCQSDPSLIWLSIPGVASEDNELLERVGGDALDDLILSGCGVFKNMGLNRTIAGIHTSYSPLSQASGYASIMGAAAVMAALVAREKSGKGDLIEVPMASALIDCLVYNGQDFGDLPPRYLCKREVEIKRRRQEGIPLDMSYEELMRDYLDPFYTPYRCKDGKQIYVLAPCHAAHQLRFVEAFDVNIEGMPRENQYVDSAQWPSGLKCGGIGGYVRLFFPVFLGKKI